MERIRLITERVEKIGQLRENEQLEFHSDGSVEIVRNWLQWAARKTNAIRKWPLPSSQSRTKTLAGVQQLLDLTNDIISGLLQKPKIRTECNFLGLNDAPNVLFDEQNSAHTSSVTLSSRPESIFETQYTDQKREALDRLARALYQLCSALNRLASSTYSEDIGTGAAILKLINYAALQRDQIITSDACTE